MMGGTAKVKAMVVNEIVAKLQHHYVSIVLDDEFIREYINPGNCNFTEARMIPGMARNYALQLLHLYYGYEVDRMELRYPEDWWEAFKERWFTKRMLKRWPVRWEHVVWKAEQAFIDVPIKSPTHKFYMRDISHMEDKW